MSPTYTMSAHLCKQIYSSWRQTRQTSPDTSSSLPSPPTSTTAGATAPISYSQRSSSPETNKRSMDNDRSDTHSSSSATPGSSPPTSSWKWGSR